MRTPHPRPATHSCTIPDHDTICKRCFGTGRDPDAEAVITGTDDLCRVCCDPLHALYNARLGHILHTPKSS
jgi:hypothetical protein